MKNNYYNILILSVVFSTLGCEFSRNTTSQVAHQEAIIGGEVASADQPELRGVHHLIGSCSSVQIGEKVLLSAAHCFTQSPLRKAKTSFKVGESFYFGDVLNHEKYSTLVGAYDLSMVFLDEDFKGLDTKNNFQLPPSNELPEELFAAGYGATGLSLSSGGDQSDLKFLRISKSESLLKDLSKESMGSELEWETREDLQAINKDIKEGRMFCFKAKDRKNNIPFFGDSGGPLYSVNEKNQPVLHGIFSMMSLNGEGVHFFCYESVFPKLSWIQDRILNGRNLLPKGTLTIATSSGRREVPNRLVEGVEVASEREVVAEVVHGGLGRWEDLERLDLQGKIVLIERGQIPFYSKVMTTLQKPGVVGIIFYDNVEGPLMTPALTPGLNPEQDIGKTDIRFISQKEGLSILAELAGGNKVKAALRVLNAQ